MQWWWGNALGKILELSKASKKQDRQLDHQVVSDLFAGITMRFSTGMVAARTFIIMDDNIIKATFFSYSFRFS